jgi:cytochrome c-type biogenesis protein CcmH
MTNNFRSEKIFTRSRLVRIIGSLFLILVFLFRGTAFAADETVDEATRFLSFTKEVRCIVCQNQNLAESTAPLAKDLRDKIHKMILEKKSDEEIKNYLVKRYGEFILLRPRLNKLTYLLWTFPLLGCFFVAWYLFYFSFSSDSQKSKSVDTFSQ